MSFAGDPDYGEIDHLYGGVEAKRLLMFLLPLCYLFFEGHATMVIF